MWDTVPATIPGGSSLSGGVDLGGLRLFGLVMPSQWTTAPLTFQGSIDEGVTWHNLKDSSGNEISITAAANDFVVWLPAAFSAVELITVRSGTAATPVLQSGAAAIQLVLRSI
jgi:hypothetical protein